MAIRKIVQIDEEKCNGCGLCVPGCAEGAIKIVNGKAKLVADNLCDGLGNCIGHCPQGAIKIIEREADEFDEEAVEKHLSNIKAEGVHVHHGGGCPGSRAMTINRKEEVDDKVIAASQDIEIKIKPQLSQWPVQLMLVPERASYWDGKELLVTADCVPFAYPNYHLDLLKGKSVVVGCPKLDNIGYYIEKLTNIIKYNDIKGIQVAYMEVPCCRGMVMAVDEAVRRSGKNIEVKKIEISIDGRKK
ncbi:4Fe-4S ferredoxin [Caloranaerobacter azorensis H53214]|uniref:4Fe-4S ferredoxin n=1 Tax=Caloranaerobacter azorensis H53214 TaxID=1156417 RepID=A0A096BIX8_9FIRM|nr:4Fe-4S binding protein [Caloranaerobacter azorensis]KGG80708.1 4Fe-4S ferredoxin [Caloranaerobacter azorensis H53214]